MEDVIFSFGLSRKYKFVSVKNAKFKHYPSTKTSFDREKYLVRDLQVRYYFMNKYRKNGLKKSYFYWALLGKLIMILLTPRSGYFISNIRGFILGLKNLGW